MNVLLTHAYFLEEDAREQLIMKPYPPLGILYIAAFLEKHGVNNDVYDTTFSSKQAFREYLLDHKPGIIGIYVNLMTKLGVLEIIPFIKSNLPDTVIIIGGPEVRYNAANLLEHGVDFVVVGEGENTTLELIQYIKQRPAGTAQHATAEMESISGVAFLKNGQFTQTPEREKVKDLNELPMPARNKIDLHRYLRAWKKQHGKNTISISTMRGCPYTCKWCSRGVYGLSYRRRSPQLVAEEMEYLQQVYNPDSLWFVDDVFTISHKWLAELHEELKKRNVCIPYECITRADRMNDVVVNLLKETGCFRVWIGAESGSQKIIDLMDRRVEVGKVRNMIRLTRQHGMEAGTFIMLGYPGETEEDIEETIRHLKESNPDHFTITVAYPIKGTELYQEVEALQITQTDWATSTDREIDFKRTYSRKYYDFAVRRVVNEVNYFKSKTRMPSLRATAFKIKSIAAKMAMWWEARKPLMLNQSE